MLVLVPKFKNSAQSPDDQFLRIHKTLYVHVLRTSPSTCRAFKMSENGLFSSTILDCSVALDDVEDNKMLNLA